jgi:hypothetical protein
LDSGIAFIGDLPLPEYTPPESYDLVCRSWKQLIERNAKVFYHSHAGPIPLACVKEL